MARKNNKSTKHKRSYDPKKHKQNFEVNKNDADLLIKELSKEFLVNDKLIKCVEYHSKSLFDSLSMNAYLVSCINETSTPTATQTNADVLDKRGIYRSISILVQDNGWKTSKTTVQDDQSNKQKTRVKNDKSNKVPKKRKTIKGANKLKYQLVFAEDLHEYLVELAFLERYSLFCKRASDVTDGRVVLGGNHTFRTVKQYLSHWRHVIEWVNDGLPAKEEVNLDNFDESQTNWLFGKVKVVLENYFKPDSVNSGPRNLNSTNGTDVPGKLDEMFSEHRRATCDGGREVSLILGIPKYSKPKGETSTTNAAEVSIDLKGDNPVAQNGCVSKNQIDRCWNLTKARAEHEFATLFGDDDGEFEDVLQEDDVWTDKWTKLEVVTVTRSMAKTPTTNVPKCKLNRKLKTGIDFLIAEHTHVMEDWTQLIWLRRNVHSLIGKSKLSVVVVDYEWKPIGVQDEVFVSKNMSKMKTWYPANFFENVIPSMNKFHMLSEDAKVFFPMNEWFFFCLLYTSPSPRDKRQSRMPSSA